MPTPKVFDFDESTITHYDPETVDKLLIEQPALYLNHLRIARSLRGWVDEIASATYGGFKNDDYRNGYTKALREVAAHLRQGDYVEGGTMIIQHM